MRSFLRAALGWGVLLVVMASCSADEPPTINCDTVAREVAAMDSSAQDRGWFGAITGLLGFAPDSLTEQDRALDALRRDVVRRCDDFARLDTATARFREALGTQKLVALGREANVERFEELVAVLRQEVALIDSIYAVLMATHEQFRASLVGEASEDSLLLSEELARLDTILTGKVALPVDTMQLQPIPPDSLAPSPDSLAPTPVAVPISPAPAPEPPERLQAVKALLYATTPIQNIPGDSLRRIRPRIRREIARQDTVVEALKRSEIDALGEQTSREVLQALGGLMRLEITLLDSAHTALIRSGTQFIDALAVASRDEALAALHEDVVRLWDVFAAVQQSNAAFTEALGEDRLVPLGDQDRDERVREFGWQVRQEISLLDDARTALKASNTAFLDSLDEKASVDSLRQVGLQIDQGIARLQDSHAVLEQSNVLLSKVYRNAGGDGLPIDSLRQIGQQIRQEAARQRRVLDALGTNRPLLDALSEQADTEGIRELTWQMRQQIDLLDEVHEALEASNTALLDGLVGDLQQYGGKLILALLVVAFSFFLVRGLVWLLEVLSERRAARRLFFKKLIPIGRLTIWGLTIYIVLADIFQLDQRGILAAATALGVAIGFAAQDILKNIFGGILIIFDQPFQVGDKINVGGTYGEVVSIGLRSTRIVTPDDNLVSVPNSQVVDSQVANANAGALDCQVVVDLYLPGWVDVKLAASIAYNAAANSKYVYLEKPIAVRVRDEFKETFLTQLKVKAYVLDTRYEFAFASDVTETAKAEFHRQGLYQGMESVPAPLEPPANGTPEAPSLIGPS